MADDESSTEEEAPAEATLDQGPPGIGKTKMMKKLRKLYSLTIYNWPKDERWWDLYGDGQYDIIMLDEFRSQKMITDLNPILSGDPVTLSRRGWLIEKQRQAPCNHHVQLHSGGMLPKC